ncbi:MAG TPA: TonB-dependent receptor [Allosphingosinicella sp.]|jgi:iron complex outermembrane receptor protein
MKKLSLLWATTALVMPVTAFAQSTGSQEVEEEIVITGTRNNDGVDGIVVPDSTKAKGVITQELISRQGAGQTILNTINMLPSVNFTQSDAYGSAGGNIRIRGFDGNRISLTFDGMPLNDSGNYAIFSNQQLDPELIDQVNVNFGATDVDSPTASAAGGTVNYRTIIPTRDFGATVAASIGEDDYHRLFGIVQTGELTSFGTRAFASASFARNDKFKGPGEIYKQQYNARIYQPMGGDDFVSVAGHFNKNRNNFYRNPSVSDMRALLGTGEIPAATATFPSSADPILIGALDENQQKTIFGFENLGSCTKATGGPGAQNDNGGRLPSGSTAAANTAPAIAGSTANNILNTSSCSNFFEVRVNPSDTGNIRINSRFELADGLILTVDPSFQYVLANGGGSTAIAENNVRVRGANPASPGVDYNGDGDFLDTVRFFTPNNTNTHRYGLTASLIWDLSPQHRFRVAYTFDRAKHRQTGEWGFLDPGGTPLSPFGGRNSMPVLTNDGFIFQQRDRTSIALLHQVAGQYIGKFMDNKLRVEVGLRAPFFKRELNQFCFTEARGSGFAYCTSEPVSTLRIIAPDAVVPLTGAIPFYAPFKAKYEFNKLLPNVGVTYRITPDVSVFGSYAKGFSSPRTDNLYRAPVVTVDPEETDAFDAGIRYTNRQIQAQATGWVINYTNRIVSSFNPDLGISIDRNVGKVESYGVDGSIAYSPIKPLTLYAFGSYIHAELQQNVAIGALPAGVSDCGTSQTPAAGPTICAPTAGRMVAETPKWTWGGRIQGTLGPLELGLQAKKVGDRFATDTNDVRVKGYATVDLDARLNLEGWGLSKTYLQLNVINLFDRFYFGNISTQINAAGNPNFAVGAPRTIMGSVHVGF